jgi:putative glutamine amidotransferase
MIQFKKPRIAIPVPHSGKPDYAQRSLPQYVRAVEQAGGEPVVIQLNQEPDEIAKAITGCQAVLLPGSAADIDPQKYGAAEKHPKTEAADAKRDTVDELLLQDAYNLRKPVLGICYGLQMLNVYNTGTLLQHIESRVNHAAGRTVPQAHKVRVDPFSRLAGLLVSQEETGIGPLEFAVNSSHHQAADVVGDGLRVVARCPEDGIIEAVEGVSQDHWVIAVQWHPERSYDDDPRSQAIFCALVEAAMNFSTGDTSPQKH